MSRRRFPPSLVLASAVLGACASRGAPPDVRDAEAAPAARTRACEALAEQDRKAFAPLMSEVEAKAMDVRDPHADLGQCVAGNTLAEGTRPAGGAWVLVTREGKTDADPDYENGGPSLTLQVDVYFVADDGRTLRLPNAFISSGEELGTTTVAIEGTFDWDDDGVAEVAIVERQDRPDYHTHRQTFYRVSAGAVAPWVPVAGLWSVSFEDVDADARPDILDHGAFTLDIMSPMFAVDPGFAKLYHAQPSGRFASDDATCVAYYREMCPTRVGVADLPKVADEDADGALRIALCAAMYGADRGELEARLDAIYAVAYAFLADMDGASSIPSATVDVPVRLP